MLTNIRIRWDAVEDRLILRLTVRVDDGNEVDHWMAVTRRVARVWRRELQSLVNKSAQVPEQLAPQIQASLSAAHHQALAGQAPLRVEPAATTEIAGVVPQLVLRLRCGQHRTTKAWAQLFELRSGVTLTMNMTDTTLHGLVKALDHQLVAANWGIEPTRTEPAVGAPTMKTALH